MPARESLVFACNFCVVRDLKLALSFVRDGTVFSCNWFRVLIPMSAGTLTALFFSHQLSEEPIVHCFLRSRIHLDCGFISYSFLQPSQLPLLQSFQNKLKNYKAVAIGGFKETTMELSAHAADGSGSDCSCPICLESMTRSESKIYPLPCLNCDFNFCSNCVESFCRASEDDFQMASDGSRQVKIHVACPQCRSKYPLEDLEDTVLLLRSAHELAEAIMIRQYDEEEEPSGGLEETKENDPGSNNGAKKPQYRLLRDSELSSSQLARKSEFASLDVRKHLEDAFLQYEKVMAKRTLKLDKATLEADRKQRENARAMWESLLDQS